MGQVYSFIDANGETRLLAEIEPAPGGAFNGGTITDELTVSPADDTLGILSTVQAPAGFENNTTGQGDLLALIAEDTTRVFEMDTYGGMSVRAPTDQGLPSLRLVSVDDPSFSVFIGGGGASVILQDNAAPASFQASGPESSILIGNTNSTVVALHALVTGGTTAQLGFFSQAPVNQPVIPLTLPTVQQVITALVALGLVAQHD